MLPETVGQSGSDSFRLESWWYDDSALSSEKRSDREVTLSRSVRSMGHSMRYEDVVGKNSAAMPFP